MVDPEEFFEYVASERFMHDIAVRQAEDGLPAIPDTWREKGLMDQFLIAWPGEPLKAVDGTEITRQVYTDLPRDKATWRQLFANFVEKTKPYALLLCEQKEDEVVVVIESQHGSKSWHWPIEKHGPDKVLGDRVEKTNKASIGMLWRKRMPQA